VLQLSDIHYLPGVGAHCLIALNTGRCFLLQYNEHKRKLTLTKAENTIPTRMGGIVKSIFKSFEKTPCFRSCATFLYPVGNNELYTIALFDRLLQIKCFNLSAKEAHRADNTCAEVMSKELSI
jgi:hypothetical protein